MLTGLFAALMLQVLPPPGGVHWETVIREGGLRFEIDPATIVREGEIVRYTVRLPLTETTESGMRVMILRHAMNCRTRQVGIAAGDGYAGDGHLVSSRETAPADIVYEDYPPGPDADRLHDRICGVAVH